MRRPTHIKPSQEVFGLRGEPTRDTPAERAEKDALIAAYLAKHKIERVPEAQRYEEHIPYRASAMPSDGIRRKGKVAAS